MRTERKHAKSKPGHVAVREVGEARALPRRRPQLRDALVIGWVPLPQVQRLERVLRDNHFPATI